MGGLSRMHVESMYGKSTAKPLPKPNSLNNSRGTSSSQSTVFSRNVSNEAFKMGEINLKKYGNSRSDIRYSGQYTRNPPNRRSNSSNSNGSTTGSIRNSSNDFGYQLRTPANNQFKATSKAQIRPRPYKDELERIEEESMASIINALPKKSIFRTKKANWKPFMTCKWKMRIWCSGTFSCRRRFSDSILWSGSCRLRKIN